MADVTVKRIEDFEAIFGGGFRRVRAGLGVTSMGIAVMDLPPNFTDYPEHDQAHDHQEEVYTALSGRATLRAGGEEHELAPGIWIRVGPAEKRKIVTGDEPVRVLAIGGSPGRAYLPPEFTEEERRIRWATSTSTACSPSWCRIRRPRPASSEAERSEAEPRRR